MPAKKSVVSVCALYEALEAIMPRSLSCDWDNDGLSCSPNPHAPVTGILVALDPTEDVVDLAIRNRCNVILTHHPLLFRGLKAIAGGDTHSRKVIRMIGAGISAMSFHTRLDAVNGGVNDVLASYVGLKHVVPFGVGNRPDGTGQPMGRVGDLPMPVDLDTFIQNLVYSLSVPTVYSDGKDLDFAIPHITPAKPAIQYAGCGKPVKRVAVLGGAGGDEMAAAIASGADTYITGELSYHALCDAPYGPINLIAAGHYFTEFPVCRRLALWAAEACPGVPVHLAGGTRIATNH